MFAFEFAILLITSTGILSRYIISLVEKYILYKEATRRKEARAIERAATRQRRQTEREENERRRAAGEEVEAIEGDDEEEEEDEDEELDVGGWEEKGTWVFYAELCTGMPYSFAVHPSRVLPGDAPPETLTNQSDRFPQTPHLPLLFLYCPYMVRSAAAHHPRCVPYPAFVHHPYPRLH